LAAPPKTEGHPLMRRFDVQRLPRVMAIRIDEGLRFTNARWLSDVLWAELAARPDTEQLVLMMSGVNEIDLSGLEALQQFATEWQARDPQHRLHLSELKGPVADRLQRAGLSDWLPGRVFRTQAEAWVALRADA
jgi:sulfate permease, SulP family